MTEVITVPAIVFICYFIGFCVKTFVPTDKIDKFIPCICGICGAILGLVVFYTIPGYLDASNWLTALEIGIGSGLAATGINQIGKQLTKKEE